MDRISTDIVKVFWQWDPERFTQLVRAYIRLGHHPRIWKTAKGVVIPKPGKPDYSKVRAYQVISLLDVTAKLAEPMAAHLISDHLETRTPRWSVRLPQVEELCGRGGTPHEPDPADVDGEMDGGDAAYGRQISSTMSTRRT